MRENLRCSERATGGMIAASRERGEADRTRELLLTLSGWTSPRASRKRSAFARIWCAYGTATLPSEQWPTAETVSVLTLSSFR